jgi:hypothetical protein
MQRDGSPAGKHACGTTNFSALDAEIIVFAVFLAILLPVIC